MDSVMQQFTDWLKSTIKETLNKLLDKAQKEEDMDLFIICFSLAMIIYVLTLPFIGKRRKKEEVKPNYHGWEASAIAYNRAHGLPDDAI